LYSLINNTGNRELFDFDQTPAFKSQEIFLKTRRSDIRSPQLQCIFLLFNCLFSGIMGHEQKESKCY